ncbi:MAG: BlaI/MecI/CopY family transcriptional regulator [bacterium]|nr:BlaI/MecI/CopY family transcriptional regulator [bacterium]
MVRPKQDQPTPAELEVLKILWEQGESSVRDVMEVLNNDRPRAYTTVMSLLNVMTDKELLQKRAKGRAHLYRPNVKQTDTLGGMIGDLLGRAFEGSASSLVSQLLDQTNPDEQEIEAIRRLLDEYNQGDA